MTMEVNRLNEKYAMSQILDDTPYLDYPTKRYLERLESIINKVSYLRDQIQENARLVRGGNANDPNKPPSFF